MKNGVFNILVLIGLFFFNTQGVAQNNTSKIAFKVKNFGVYVNGSFSEATVTSNFDKNNLDESFITATVEINSISTNNAKRDKHLLESEFFDEINYKQLKLTSTKIEKVTANNYKVTGTLTIKKTAKTVVIPIRISEVEEGVILNATFELNRRDYGVGGSSWIMSNTVKIQVKHTIKK